jgi:hypothetical protein
MELIADLVEGRLEDESEARALIASSPELLGEYEAQKLAYETLAALGPAPLSETERASLHRDLWTELKSGAAPAKRPWYYGWAPVAAGMFVVIGLVAVVSQGGSPDAVGLAAGEESTTTQAASTEADTAGGSAVAEPDDGDAPTVAESAEDGGLDTSDKAFYSAEADRIRGDELGERGFQAFDEDSALDTCLESAGYAGYSVVERIEPGEGAEPNDMPADAGPFVAAIPEGADVETAVIVFIDLVRCELIHLDE